MSRHPAYGWHWPEAASAASLAGCGQARQLHLAPLRSGDGSRGCSHAMIKLLAKANNDVLSHCSCAEPLASLPSQLDCPWCGCGWLISCTICRRAFTFARVTEVDTDYKTFVLEDRERGRYFNDNPAKLEIWALWLEESLGDFEVGKTVVYLDGLYFDWETEPVIFEGLFSKHALARLPHFEARSTPNYLRATLGDASYWFDRESRNLPESPSES